MEVYRAPLAVLLLAAALVGAVYLAGLLVVAERGAHRVGPFLSGTVPTEHAVSRYHVRWYPITMLFLAFDMEMVFMYPWAVVVEEMGTEAVVEMFVLLALLMLGVTYVWREGALRWT